MEGSTAVFKQKTKLKGNKKEEKEKNPKGKVGRVKGKDMVLNYAKFEGQGLSYKAKLFGFVEVPGPRGDDSSVQAIQKLKQQAKQMKKDSNEHKLKITFNITLQGVRLFNEKTQTIEHEHPIHKISFISHDPEDRHVFGYIYSPPRSSANEKRKYYLFAIKSDKSADVITVQLYELFQVVYKMQENKKAHSKDSTEVKQRWQEKSSQPLEPLQDKMLLEMSNKIGGDQQQHPQDEHLYAEPTFVKRTPSEPSSDYAVPNDQPVQASSTNERNEYKVPRQDEAISEREREDIATAIALSLSMHENSQPSPDDVSTPVGNDKSGFENVFDSTVPHTTEEVSNQNAFHAEFSLFQNGLVSPGSQQAFSESSNDSEKFSIPVVNEKQQQPLNDISSNAFDDMSSNGDMKVDMKTNENKNTETNSDVRSSSELSGEATCNSSKVEDVNCPSTKVELQPVEGNVNEMVSINPTTENSSSIEIEKQDDETETSTTTGNFATDTSFEVNFEIEKEDKSSSEQTQPVMFSFDAFSSDDPFASTDPTEFDESAFTAFGDDDPFSPKGGSNVNTKSDPFCENDNPFTADFSDVDTDDFKQPKQDIPVQASSENDENSNREDDVFEAMFEARMEEQLDDETVNKNKNENEGDVEQNQVELDLEKPSDDVNAELDYTEKEITETTVEYQTEKGLLNKKPSELTETEELNSSPDLETKISNDQHVDTEGSKDNNINKANTFDFSSNDVYVTLKTAALPNDRPQSPTEFSPPPLPPRPAAPKELVDTVISPKIPPALPPRPAMNQPPNLETTVRKPPELPPRLDLDENDLVENELEDPIQEPNVQSFAKDTESPMFQADFDNFDFDNVENNNFAGDIGTPTAEFDSNDPFKDPFAGADPFQTPLAGDPFSSPASFDRNIQQDSDDFDPFSGDDPFAMTPAFDAETSFGSPNLPSSNEPNNDEEKDKISRQLLNERGIEEECEKMLQTTDYQ